MLSMPLRKQGGAAIVTIPTSVMQKLNLKVGEELAMDVRNGALVVTPVKVNRSRRLSLAELMVGVTPARVKSLNRDTAWAREGSAIGRELA